MTTEPTRPRGSVARRLHLGRLQLVSWRPSWSWAIGVVRSFVTSFLALAGSLWLLPGEQARDGAASVAALVVVVLVIGALLRPLLTTLTVLTGIVGLLVAGVLAQAVVLSVALSVVPSVEPFSYGEVVLASWAAAVVAAFVNWLFDTSTDEAFLGQLLGRAVRRTRAAGVEGPGLLVVQLDGVSLPVLRQAITAGSMPTVSRWVRSGGHELRGWHTGVPATTPAGQAAILHGDVTHVPGYRWWDKEQGRMLVMSRPADAGAVERAMSDGRGLLADGGASVSNLFSGDAPHRVLTLSDGRLPGADHAAASYANARFGLLRSVVLFVGQMITEWYQGRRQRIRDVVPRVRRGGTFVVLRGVTTVVLRDLDVAVVADHLTQGTPVVYVDFVDYDEVAHHAGPTRPESLRTLENLDRVLGFFERLSREVGRRYEIALVSDHGQAQGSTFRQLAGRPLDDVVQELAREQVHTEDHPGEQWAPANLLIAGSQGSTRAVTRAARSVARGARPEPPPVTPEQAPLVVAASGSLAHVYRTDEPGRLTRERLDELHPGLVRGLAAHPQVGLVLTRRADGALVAEGAAGWRVLGEPTGDGDDPVAPYGPHAEADLLQLAERRHVGDLVLLGAYDRALGEVVAFEELVGSHGGLGGWQTEALLVHPRGWTVPGSDLDGPAVHRALVGRLAELGLREAP